jgi:hypothetical protein
MRRAGLVDSAWEGPHKVWRLRTEGPRLSRADARVLDAIRSRTEVARGDACTCHDEVFEAWILHLRTQRERAIGNSSTAGTSLLPR